MLRRPLTALQMPARRRGRNPRACTAADEVPEPLLGFAAAPEAASTAAEVEVGAEVGAAAVRGR